MRVFHDLVIYFVLFSVSGWVCESVFCSIYERRPVNRGFLNGPVCPVYGFGGLMVVYVLAPFRENIPLLFVLGMISTTTLEYLTSLLLEKLFDTRWWGYSENRFNLNGRVCLSFSLIFGALSVAAVRLLYPPFYLLAGGIPGAAKPWLAWGMLALFSADCAVTVVSVLKLNGKLAEMEDAMQGIRQKLEGVSGWGVLSFSQMLEHYLENTGHERYEAVRASIDRARARLQELTAQRRFLQSRLLRAFPTMRSLKYREQLARLRESLDKKLPSAKNRGKDTDND